MSQQHTSGYNHWSGSHEAVAGLLDLKSGLDGTKGSVFKRLEDIALTHDRVQELFNRFFTFYHPFCPFLNPDRSPEDFYKRSPLLFWMILSVAARRYTAEPTLYTALSGPVTRLMWSTFAEVPQNYHVVKALILVCTWPFPTSSTSTDPTFILCGIMMQIALQIGLHRPTHAQDFTKFRIELREAEVQDRIRTWAVCNIVAQRVATASGQPALTMYDLTLRPTPDDSNPNFDLPPPIYNRLLVEKFVDKVSKTLYSRDRDPSNVESDRDRSAYVSFLVKDFEILEDRLRGDPSPITVLYLRAAYLHLRLNAFFSPPTLPSYREDLLKLYHATTSFLEVCLSLDSTTDVALPSNYHQGLSLAYGTSYIFQMMLAAGFSLLKLMHNFLGQHELDIHGASELLTRTVWAIRNMSVVENDLADRLAEVLAQVWKSGRVRAQPNENSIGEGEIDDSLVLKVRCRMSMSLVFDSVWRWRNYFQIQHGKSIEAALRNRTFPPAPQDAATANSSLAGGGGSLIDPSMTGGASSSSTSLTPSASLNLPNMNGFSNDMSLGGYSMDYSEAANYEVFDPLNWMLDGLVDFPYAALNAPDGSSAATVHPGGIGVSGLGGEL